MVHVFTLAVVFTLVDEQDMSWNLDFKLSLSTKGKINQRQNQ